MHPRTRPSFCMSLRASAHTGVAIRVPAEEPGKSVVLRANSSCFSYLPKVFLFVLWYCKEYGLPRRFAPRNDMQKLAACQRLQQRGAGQIRTHLPSLSLRTSAHTGVAIRIPAEKPGKSVVLRANSSCFSDSPKALLSVMPCRRRCGLPRRFAPRNDMLKFAGCPRLQGGRLPPENLLAPGLYPISIISASAFRMESS